METTSEPTPAAEKSRRILRIGKRIALGLLVVVVVAIVVLGIAVKDDIRTLWSFQRVPNTNMYTMDYYGDYHIAEVYEKGIDPTDVEGSLSRVLLPDAVVPWVFKPRGIEKPPRVIRRVVPAAHSCSTVSFRAKDGQVYVGRNFDWMHEACLILRIHGRDHFSSVAVLDLQYLGIRVKELEHLSLADRVRLLGAPFLVMDGMNEYGVAVTEMQADGSQASEDPGKPTIINPLAMRLILDYARNTDEALALLGKYNIQFPVVPCHYLITDAQGKSVVVEFIGGRMETISSPERWQVSTNHLLLGKSESENDRACSRYRRASDRLAMLDGQIDAKEVMQVMASVSVENWTMWTSVYNLATGEFQVVHRRKFDRPYSGHLEMRRPPAGSTRGLP